MDEIETYQEARRAMALARTQVTTMVAAIQEIAKTLGRWEDVIISNASPPAYFPIGLSLDIDAQKWPSIEKLTAALLAAHEADKALTQAWGALPAAKREGMMPPEPLRRA